MGNVISNVSHPQFDLGGGVIGGIAPTYSWAFEGLESSLAGFSIIDNSSGQVHSAEWDAGGFARLTWAAEANAGTFGLRYNIPSGKFQSLTQFDIRRHGTKTSKILKSPGINNGTGNPTSNYTFGATLGGYVSAGLDIYYSDSVNGGDNSTGYTMTGSLGGGTSETRATPTKTVVTPGGINMSVDGVTWDTYEVFVKFNETGIANGEIGIRKNGTLILHFEDVWNCAEPAIDGARFRKYAGLGEYSSSRDFYEDYRNFKIGYDRPAWLT